MSISKKRLTHYPVFSVRNASLLLKIKIWDQMTADFCFTDLWGCVHKHNGRAECMPKHVN